MVSIGRGITILIYTRDRFPSSAMYVVTRIRINCLNLFEYFMWKDLNTRNPAL